MKRHPLMKTLPSDIRDMAWADIRDRVDGLRRTVYEALLEYGPCASKYLSACTGLSVLTIRPRMTELYQVGLIELVDRSGHDGIYRAVPLDEAEAKHKQLQEKPRDAEQMLLAVG